MENVAPLQCQAVVAYDATKDLKENEFKLAIHNILMRGDILSCGNTLLVLGVLHTVQHPMGYQIRVCNDSAFSPNARGMEEVILKKVDLYVSMLLHSAQQCDDEGIDIKVKITAGSPVKKVILQEVMSGKANWCILDRHLRKDLKFYERSIPCKVVIIQDCLSVKVVRSHPIVTSDIDVLEQKLFSSLWKSVEPFSTVQDSTNNEQSVSTQGSHSASDVFPVSLSSASRHKLQEGSPLVSDEAGGSSKQESTGKDSGGGHKNIAVSHTFPKPHSDMVRHDSSVKTILCAGCGLRTAMYIKQSMRFNFDDIKAATSEFSKESLLGEGGFGHVYKGHLKDGQVIAAKLQKEASSQGYSEFRSEVHVLSFVRHKNIVMLLGYSSKENQNVVVYEYICNKSLEWHLLNESAALLEWHKRYAIAIGTAKGLRFLHEECRGGPIIHRDLRPSNILLTHDFVPMIGDFGLAKWKINDESIHTRVLGTLGYLAPEYAENGIVSVRTDVYAFGIVLLQLISGRMVIDEKQGQHQSLLQWAEPLLERLALHELIDPRIEDSFDTYELYHMVKAAYLCVRSKAEMRPSMGEVVRLLEGDHVQDLVQQFMPHYAERLA